MAIRRAGAASETRNAVLWSSHGGVSRRREDFEQAGVEVRVSSDDGSVGRLGYVTELLREISG